MILVTGAEGLIGRHVSARLEADGHEIRRFDLRRSVTEDICSSQAISRALVGVHGVVHLAAVSRVIWGERNPELCIATNVTALNELTRLCVASGTNPWLIFSSSREVYGQARQFPVHEDDVKRPINTYARSKAQGELIVENARRVGLTANICRFSSVYGCPWDHHDRVVTAFALAAAMGGKISVEGSRNTFDFTFIDDAVDGLHRLVQATMRGKQFPPIHFVTGRGTTLGELAELSRRHARASVSVQEAPARAFDVSSFIGDPGRAEALLGWKPHIEIEDSFPRLVGELAGLATEGWPSGGKRSVKISALLPPDSA